MQTLSSPTATDADAARQASGPRVLQFLRVTLGPDAYAVRIDAVREILEMAQVTPVPLMPAFVRGVMNLRGAVVPVIDLGIRVGLDATRIGPRTCVVIADVGERGDGTSTDRPRHTLGMLVDAVHEVFDHAEAELEPVPRLGTRVDAGLLRAMVRVRGVSTPELDLEQILGVPALAALIAADAAH